MRSRVKKAACCVAMAAAFTGLMFASACSDYYDATALDGDYSYTDVVSNGGFAVEAGNYIYFINGVESSDADNTYGDVQKGSIVRISKEDYAAGNYTNVDTVVPSVIYSGNHDSGIYIYGDYIYYTTPSTTRDSSGDVQNDSLDFKCTKLDGTGTSKSSLLTLDNGDVEYRFVEDSEGNVFLLYVVSEAIFDGISSTAYNIHSLQITGDNAGTNTLLAYNVDGYTFDTSNLESPYIYYTMYVTEYMGSGYNGESTDISSTADYNQVYRVCAYETDGFTYTEEDKYDFSYVDDYDYDENPLYVNRGELVFDGIGTNNYLTQFNYEWVKGTMDPSKTEDRSSAAQSVSGYTYSLTGYQDGTLLYTRTYYSSDDSADNTPILFYLTDTEIDTASEWDAVEKNPQVLRDDNGDPTTELDSHTLILNAGSVSDYTFYTSENGTDIKYVTYTEETSTTSTSGDDDEDDTTPTALMWAKIENGAVDTDNAKVMVTGSDTINRLFTNTETTDAGETYTFLYFSVSSEGNGYSIHRIALYGDSCYGVFTNGEEDESNYYDTKILDLDAAISWYSPEIIENQLMFASYTDDMADYKYIMVCDLRDDDNVNYTKTNYELEQVNDLYEEITGVIEDIDTSNYENLQNAIYYLFYTRDSEYLADLVQMWVDEGEDEEYLYSKESQQLYLEFFNATGEYEDYGTDADWSGKSYENLAKSKTVNEETVYSTSRDYFYTLIGYMSDDDAEDYIDDLRSSYMQAEPEEVGWWDGLENWEKGLFIAGMCLAGVLVIGAAVVTTIILVRRKRRKLPAYTKSRKIKVDTTDDKNINVYDDEPLMDDKE